MSLIAGFKVPKFRAGGAEDRVGNAKNQSSCTSNTISTHAFSVEIGGLSDPSSSTKQYSRVFPSGRGRNKARCKLITRYHTYRCRTTHSHNQWGGLADSPPTHGLYSTHTWGLTTDHHTTTIFREPSRRSMRNPDPLRRRRRSTDSTQGTRNTSIPSILITSSTM